MTAQPVTATQLEESLGAWIKGAVDRLGRAGIDSARLDARLLAAHVLGWDQAKVLAYSETLLAVGQRDQLEALLARREGRAPLAVVTGSKEFWGLEFAVTGDTLVPRPDSETLIEGALAAFGDKNQAFSILDLGTGTGCLLLSLLSEFPNADGLGIDISEAALNVAGENARQLGLAERTAFACSDWGDAIEGTFDLVVSNPPYIADKEFAGLEKEVSRFEPRLALSGGVDGLQSYQVLIPRMGRLLAPGGRIFVEIGATQAAAVSALLSRQGIDIIDVLHDIGGNPRVVEGQHSTEK